METGTGKAYVYLRSVFELHKRYGFTKFVIVTPTVDIREGTVASIELLRDDLKSLYPGSVHTEDSGQDPHRVWATR